MVTPIIRDARGRFADLGRGRGSIKSDQVALAMGSITDIATRATLSGLTVSLREAAETAATEVAGTLAEDISLFSQSLRNNTRRNRDPRVRQVHEIAGQRAQAALVRGFRARHPSRGPSVSSTRQANGALARTLGSPGMYLARYDGVAFINSAMLDRTAKQWYRLNFGAGVRGAETVPPGRDNRHNVEFFGATVANLSLRGNRPSGAFTIPDGAWIKRDGGLVAGRGARQLGVLQGAPGNELGVRNRTGGVTKISSNIAFGVANRERRGRDEFLSGGANSGYILEAAANLPPGGLFYGSRKQVTLGIQGSNYLDTGLRSLADNLGTGWSVLLREWFQEAAVSDTGPVAQRVALTPGENPDIQRSLTRIAEAQGDMRQAFRIFESSLR